MTFDLFDFQDECVSALAKQLRRAQEDFEEDKRYTAVGLVAPTAAGKTVMAADLLIRLLDGDAATDGNSDLTVIWMSDQPSLNAQSMNKLNIARPALSHHRMVALSDFDQRLLDPGKIHFTHVQQFGKGATSMHAEVNGLGNDNRTYGVWDMIANTVVESGSDVLLIIDEAHRGVGVSPAHENKTILNTLIHGGTRTIGGTHPPMPVVLGVSATIARFENSVRSGAGPTRTMVPIEADVAKVRESGLLKDTIVIPKPAEDQEADQTLIAENVARFKRSTEMWAEYHADTGAPLVEPVMVIQVRPGVTRPELATILTTLEASWNVLKNGAIAHAFDTRTDIAVTAEAEKRTIRYISPESISDDDRVRVVLFKTALTTGWDCPRAEVMVSLRGSADPTNIAQLIGRMVRTPLARRIEDGEPELNEVTLSLPLYDMDEVGKVVEALTADAGTRADTTIFPVVTTKNQNVPSTLFDILGSIPSAIRPKPQFPNITARARSLAKQLASAPFSIPANAVLDKRIVGAVKAAYNPETAEGIDNAAHDELFLEMTEVEYTGEGKGYAASETGELQSVAVQEADLEKSYKKAKSALPDSAADLYHDALIEDGLETREAEARVIAMSKAPAVKTAIEQAAEKQIEEWRNKFESKAKTLSDSSRASAIVELWAPTETPTSAERIIVPETVVVASAARQTDDDDAPVGILATYPKHLYSIEGTDEFPFKPGSAWETDVLTKALAAESLVGWYRNPSSGKHALSVQYDRSLLHPDFNFFHEQDGKVVVDILDPHQHSGSDTGPKWRALAAYARTIFGGEDYDGWLRNVWAIIKAKNPSGEDVLRAIDLCDAGVEGALEGVSKKEEVEAVFAEHGFDY